VREAEQLPLDDLDRNFPQRHFLHDFTEISREQYVTHQEPDIMQEPCK